jgi:hypothetical protein
LQENGLGLGLGVRGQGAYDFSGEAMERVFESGFRGLLGRRLLRESRWRSGQWFRGAQRHD